MKVPLNLQPWNGAQDRRFRAVEKLLNLWWWLKCRRVCAWCLARMGGNPRGWRVSHGICPACRCRFYDDDNANPTPPQP